MYFEVENIRITFCLICLNRLLFIVFIQYGRWQWCWWHRYVDDFMMVTNLRCWWQNHYAGVFFGMLVIFPMYQIRHQHPDWVTNISNLSPTHLVTDIRHQYRCNQYGLPVWSSRSNLVSCEGVTVSLCDRNSDVGHKIMLSTLWWWQFVNVGERTLPKMVCGLYNLCILYACYIYYDVFMHRVSLILSNSGKSIQYSFVKDWHEIKLLV